MDTDKHGFRNANCAGARLCPQDQPQRVANSYAFGLSDVLRLVFDTAALREKFFKPGFNSRQFVKFASKNFLSVCICVHPWLIFPV